MKKTILNLGAILMAFIIGIAINNACAGSLDNTTDAELRKLVTQLQQEVNNLKNKVAELENKISSINSAGLQKDDSSFEIDGLHYSRDGYVSDPIDYYEVSDSYTITNGERITNETSDYKVTLSYDASGRVVKSATESLTSIIEHNYSYSEKKCNVSMVTTYKNPQSNGGLSESGHKIVYHYK